MLAPDDGSLHNALGTIHLDAGRLEAAMAAFRTAIDRGYPLAHTNLGICWYRLGHRTAANASFEKAVELLPHHPVARANLRAAAAALP